MTICNCELAVAELEKRLVSQFPEQFHLNGLWLGISIGSGWESIVVDVCRQVQAKLSDSDRCKFHWTQIKQKLGRLVMYWRPCAECLIEEVCIDGEMQLIEINTPDRLLSADIRSYIESVVAAAALRAATCCENCGSPGTLHSLEVLCDACVASRSYIK